MARQGATAPPATPASIEHQSAGRVRVRVRRQHRSPERMEQVRAQLAAHPDIRSVDVNPRTGSILVRGDHTGGLRAALGEILQVVDEAGPENVQEAGIETVVVLLSQVDRRIQLASGSRLSLRWLVPASFIAVAIRQLLRSGFTVGELPWFVLLYYGVDSFLKLYPHHAPKAPGPPKGTAA